MTATGALMWAVFCTVVGLLAGAAVSTLFNTRRNKASRKDGGYWFRRYALGIGGGLFALNFVVRYLFWLGRSFDSGNNVLRAHGILSILLIGGLVAAGWWGWRSLRKARGMMNTAAAQYDAVPGGVLLPTSEQGWWVVSCRRGHEVYVQGGTPGAYCQHDGDWVQMPGSATPDRAPDYTQRDDNGQPLYQGWNIR